ncbi:MAG: sigma-70 family RNA polymerase sigma factor [Sedimentisphaerales bacterium]|nr:sigma-70 family RNA polymerase sigma factor [Sedimentisphaerales bacterium]
MTKSHDVSELVSRAKKGHRESLGELSAHVRQKVFVYLYRMTLDYHLAQDLAQETVLYMIESLPRLKTTNSSSIWAWIYRSAWGKFQHTLRPQGHQRIIQKTIVDHEILMQLTDETKENALEHAERTELFEAICESLDKLEKKHRNVLVLRCYELLSYAEIAAVMGNSELQARLLFFRAKHALKRHLQNRGYGRKYFLTSLTLFGLITGMQAKSTSAAVTVTANMLKAGAMATTLGAVTTKTGLIATAVVTIGLVAGSVHVCNSNVAKPKELTQGISLAVQNDTQWELPLQIITSNDPEENGWQAVSLAEGKELSKTVPLDIQTILARQWENCYVIIPEGHWIEFGFERPLVNGVGFDIRYDCLETGNFPDLFLADGQGQTFQLTNPIVEPLEDRGQRVSFELTNVIIPFEPVGIRIQGRGFEGQWKAPVVFNLEARISP